MADTLSNLVPNKTNPKLIETNNFMIINGTLYDKGSLAVTKKSFSFGAELGNNILHISRSMHLTDEARIDKRSKIVDINEDIYIENRSYIILNSQYSNVNNTTSFIISLNENDDDIELLNSYNEDGLLFQKIVCITNDNIIAVAKRINANSSPGQIYCFNKNLSVIKVITLNSTWWYSYDDPAKGEICKVYEDNTFLYILNNGHDNGGGLHSDLTVVCKLNKNTLEYETQQVGYDNLSIPTETVDHVHDLYKYGNNVYFFYYRANDTRAASRNDIYKCKIDTTSALSITRIKTETYNNMKNIFFAERIYRQLGYFIKDNFLFYYIADETNSSSSVLNYQGIHKIQISGDFNLSYIKRINTSTTNRIISILFDESYDKIIVGYWQSFDILVYNDVTQEYEKIGNTYTGIKNVGMDALNRLWYEKTNGEIHTENFDDPQDVIVKFEKPYYSYLSGEIETYLTFQARSSTGAVPSGRYMLKITSGNAYFKETGTNELTINYESTSQDDDHYPLMITGAKRIVCNVSFEKVW